MKKIFVVFYIEKYEIDFDSTCERVVIGVYSSREEALKRASSWNYERKYSNPELEARVAEKPLGDWDTSDSYDWPSVEEPENGFTYHSPEEPQDLPEAWD